MRTKIIATLGPSSSSQVIMNALVREGMDVARMNFSHCTYAEYRTRLQRLQHACQLYRRHVSVLMDLQGPRLRVGKLPKQGLMLREGDRVVFCTGKKQAKGVIHIDDPYLHTDVRAGDPLFLANGALELTVTRTEGRHIYTKVIRGGRLFSRKAVNAPRTKLTTSGLTEKDRADVAFGLAHGVDTIALSFVQSAADIHALREIVGHKVKIVAKIELAVALPNIDAIIQAADAIMIARGDLGTEVPIEQVPFIQKNLIRHAAWHGKSAITATQMLYSMTQQAHPTRAEVSDVTNAVLDGSDAVMLSDETASGMYPAQALQMMVKIVKRAEHYHVGHRSIF